MGILNKIFGRPMRQPVGGNISVPVVSPAPPYENYYTRGATPNTPFVSSYSPDPYREHASPANLRGGDYRTHYDAGVSNNTFESRSDLQRYFDEKTVIERTPSLVPAHGVVVPAPQWKRGWTQAPVPDQYLMNSMVTQSAPPALLSRPIKYTSTETVSGYRAPIQKVRAPKPNHGG